ncbi:MAG: iron-containing alcohol dehydrogenase, partial [Rhodobacteraceae bacterium]|nr:iron-containing alcohol dehydrogenase [Paracoccaceae bacterium]
ANRAAATGAARAKLDEVCSTLAGVLGCTAEIAPARLQAWAQSAGLPDLAALGVTPAMHAAIVAAAEAASSMKGNPVSLPPAALRAVLEAA